MVIDGEISIGDISSFVMYTITMSTGLMGIGDSANAIISATGVAEKVLPPPPPTHTPYIYINYISKFIK